MKFSAINTSGYSLRWCATAFILMVTVILSAQTSEVQSTSITNVELNNSTETKNNKLTFNPAFIYSQRIQSSTDDAREDLSKASMKLTEADVKFGKLNANDDAGLRFTNLNIPENATITSAFMYWDNGESSKAKSGSVQIYAENSGTPATFSSNFPDISNRTKTTNSVTYDISWSGGETNQQTPDLSAVVQEVVDNNNGLTDFAFILVENGSSNDELKIISYDDVPAQSALLEVNYEEEALSVNEKDPFLSMNTFPNPSTNVVVLEFDVFIENLAITLLSSKGQIVKEYSGRNKKTVQLDLHDLSSGLYFARIKIDQEMGIIKIIKQ